MNKWISLLLAISILLSFTACGSKNEDEPERTEQSASTDQSTEPTVNELEEIRKNQAEIEWSLDDNGVLTISGNGAMPDYAMRSADNDIEMTVDSPWFERRLEVKRIIIEEGITYVGEWAFSGSNNLTEVSFPDSLIGFGMGALGGNALTELVLPDNIKYLGKGMFAGCESLEKVTIGEGITSIPYAAFYKCTSLQEVHLPSGLVTIGEDAFYDCNYLKTINFPEGLQTIGEAAFSECWRLTDVVLPDTITSMQAYCFYNSGLKEIVLPESLLVVRDGSFVGCPNLKKITVPVGVQEIEKSAFSGCDALEEVIYLGTAEDWAKVTAAKIENELFLQKLHENLTFSENDSVSLVMDYRFENGMYGFTANYRVPKLNISGGDVDEINQIIQDTVYQDASSCIDSIEKNGWAHQREVSFQYKIKDNILSLLIHTHEAESAIEHYYVYNVSLPMGKQLNKSDVLKSYDLSEEDYQKLVKNAINKYLDDRDFGLDDSLLEKTLSDESIDAALLYIGEGGNLEVIVTIYVPAGSGYSYVVLSV